MLIPILLALAPADDAYDACMEAASSNAGFSACGAAMLDRGEAELNRTWKNAIADLDAPSRSALLAEQRLWIAYKDKSCAYWASGAFGREGQSVHFYTCRAQVIEQRIDYLKHVGDTGAPEGA